MILSAFWWGVLEKSTAGIFSGLVLLVIGAIVYKRIRKKQTIDEAVIKKELQLHYVINEFKRIKNKYSKPLTEKSFSSQVEQELANLYARCGDVKDLCKQYNIPLESDLVLVMNYIHAYKGVLYCNNPGKIDEEKIPLFQQINKMKEEGVGFNKASGREFYLELYKGHESEINALIEDKKFFKKYW